MNNQPNGKLPLILAKGALFCSLLAFPCVGRAQACAPAPSGLVAWWPGQQNGLDAAGDQNGTLENGLSFCPGEVGAAFLFDTTNADLHIAASSAIDVGTGGGFTLEAWINPSDVSQTHPLFEWNDGTFWGVHFHIAPGQPFNANPGPGELYANVVDSGGGWHQLSSPGGTVLSNVFQHVALTYDRASGVATIYCDGQIASQQPLGSFTPLTSQDLYLGRRVAPADEAATFAGAMDEATLYNRALSQTEIQAIYNAGAAGKCPYLGSLSLGLYAGLTLSGTVGATFGIEYTTNLNSPSWITLTNITLTQAAQLWVDTSVNTTAAIARYYRAVPAAP